ncbi:Adenosylcobinamide amidohydrolase [Halomonas shengliensis]|uniref:Adenosylcobinamide amidohydrolase n=1 Tax=Halomonas shengliensis TaxID=419597 RepID=A0A1H0IJZ9_9GAMM|nr:adenosylcobinamide amidohydrolase [Halomonas shengliensis]SDO31757.1 Adenosylcobinamide amidohydrolase [Halomonas shengliensis]
MMSDKRLAFGPGLALEVTADCVHLAASRPLWTLSSALVGGGFGWRRHFCNFHVDKGYAGGAPAADLADWLAARRLPEGESLAMMTAVRLEHLRVEAGPGVLAAVTAGAGNAVDIAAPLAGDPRPVGTINTLLLIDGHLTDGALVNACLSASEAKVRALHSLGVLDPHSGTPASGTSTDCLAVAATQVGELTPYAGSGTRLGRALGQAVYRATRASLLASREWRQLQQEEGAHG